VLGGGEQLYNEVIRTYTGAVVVTEQGWCVLMTTFIAGSVSNPTPASLRLLGTALGRLHRLTLDHYGLADPPVGKSWLHLERAVPHALTHYIATASVLPARWRATHAAFCATLQAMKQCRDLPQAIIHGDAWAGNIVQTEPEHVVLIDWELAGQGLAILDLGRLLLFCHEDLDPPSSLWIEPATWRIEAVVDGYCQQRIPLLAERGMLLEAMRYPIVIEAASEFPRAQQHAWDEESQERLRLREHWHNVSEAIAHQAVTRINQYV